MARKRRRKRSGAAPAEASPSVSEAAPEIEAALPVAEDISCLIHPSHNLDIVCDDCAVALCRVCALSFGPASVCSDCFSRRVAGRRRGGSWHGWAGLLGGLLALAAMLAPFTLAEDPRVVAAFPGGATFFIYGSSLGAALGVLFGFGAQDYEGAGRRAGWCGAALGLVVLGINCLMNVTAALGS